MNQLDRLRIEDGQRLRCIEHYKPAFALFLIVDLSKGVTDFLMENKTFGFNPVISPRPCDLRLIAPGARQSHSWINIEIQR
ncbi:MAG: hypothetical protein HW387_1460 [Parachlamydiales bacterium]|nr:hypothetical protein [Parachlamydiales bacterium]